MLNQGRVRATPHCRHEVEAGGMGARHWGQTRPPVLMLTPQSGQKTALTGMEERQAGQFRAPGLRTTAQDSLSQ